MATSIAHVPIVMVRTDLDGIADMSIPEGYRLRRFEPGDESAWARVETAAGEFTDPDKALGRFAGEFGAHLSEMRERCLFLSNSEGEVVGTTTAWHNPEFQGRDYGRIHWVAVVPACQGKGLGRLLVTKALILMRRWHERAYLTTQTTSWVAVHLYLTLGFQPFLTSPSEEAGWELLREKAPHPLLRSPPYPRGAW
jgi:ribosomal protein S18 acetylase RimI-like enzyme